MTFKLQVDKFIADSEELVIAVAQDAIQDLAIEANTPVSQGGRMRVDTSFLRNSITAKIGSLPSGQNVAPENYSLKEWKPTGILPVINSFELGQVIYIGWTANYAQYRENKDFFARTAAQNWQQLISKSAMKLKAVK